VKQGLCRWVFVDSKLRPLLPSNARLVQQRNSSAAMVVATSPHLLCGCAEHAGRAPSPTSGKAGVGMNDAITGLAQIALVLEDGDCFAAGLLHGSAYPAAWRQPRHHC
jgi:hypothetical protein